MSLSAKLSRPCSRPLSCQTTTTDAKISMALSSPKPVSADELVRTAAIRMMTVPTTFQPRVAYSSQMPRRSSEVDCMM